MGARRQHRQSHRICVLQELRGAFRSVRAQQRRQLTALTPPLCSQNVEPVGRRFIVAVDVSTSLSSVVPGTPVSTAVAAAAIAMVRRRSVPEWLGRLWLWIPVSSFPPSQLLLASRSLRARSQRRILQRLLSHVRFSVPPRRLL